MEKRRKITLIVGLVALLVVLLAFTVVYHLPKTVRWSGTAVSMFDEKDMAEISLDLKAWEKLTRPGGLTGTVTVNGAEYRSEDAFDTAQTEYKGAGTRFADLIDGIKNKSASAGIKRAQFPQVDLARSESSLNWIKDSLLVTADGSHIEVVWFKDGAVHQYNIDLP